jgi:peptide/nickel transport system substrate-binding protein
MRKLGLALAVAMGLAGPVSAQDLTLGTKLELNTMDPHFFNGFPPASSHTMFFESLVYLNEKLEGQPALATSWRSIDDTTWEFVLRRNVRFHDGTAFDADDVIATLTRVPAVPNSPASFGTFTRSIVETVKVDSHTLRFRTNGPNPTLPQELARVFVISKAQAAASTADFNSGRAVNGTGPYRLVEWVNGERLVARRNDEYWGTRATWARVTERVIASDAARMAALLSGAVDAVDLVPAADLPRLRGDRRFALSSGPAAVVHYIAIDSARENSPFVQAPGGGNPLRDKRVRKALSHAIQREAICGRLMEGTCEPASQLLPPRFAGTSQKLRADAFDVERARALLREAGVPTFKVTLHATNDRYPKDRDIAQAVAQMWTRAGLETAVEGVPGAVFFGQATNQAYSMFIAQYGSDEALQPLRALIATFDASRGLGSANRVRYSNPAFDALLIRAATTMDLARRAELLAQSVELAMEEQAAIPVFFPTWDFASKTSIEIVPRPERRFNAGMIRPKG